MKMRVVRGYCAAALLLLPNLCLGQDYLLYEPKASTAEQLSAAPENGVLVKSITVRRGDTLKKIARRYLGKDWLFPQVLLFNNVKDPDHLQPGEKLLVPVSAEQEIRRTERAKKALRAKSRKQKSLTEAPARTEELPLPPPPKPVPAAEEALPAEGAAPKPPPPPPMPEMKTGRASGGAVSDGQSLYQAAKLAYNEGDYRRAADLFTEYVQRHGNSPLAADAALYRADCYLRMSEQ